MKDLCPVTCLKETPSDCLDKYITNQYQVINDINGLISNSTFNDKFYHLKTGKKIKEQTDFTDSNYSNPEIIRAVNYLYLNSYPVGDPNYNLILNERKNLSIDNKLNSSISSSTNNQPKLTPPAIIFGKNSNMKISSDKK